MVILSIDLRLKKTFGLRHNVSESHCVSSLGSSLSQIFPQRGGLLLMVLLRLLLVVSIHSWRRFYLPNY